MTKSSLSFPKNFPYISFVDSTCIPVIYNTLQSNMKVFRGLALKGRNTMEWYVGFKLRLLCNDKGELVNFVLTHATRRPGTVCYQCAD